MQYASRCQPKRQSLQPATEQSGRVVLVCGVGIQAVAPGERVLQMPCFSIGFDGVGAICFARKCRRLSGRREFDVRRSLLLDHALLYNGCARQARGSRIGINRMLRPASSFITHHAFARPAAFRPRPSGRRSCPRSRRIGARRAKPHGTINVTGRAG